MIDVEFERRLRLTAAGRNRIAAPIAMSVLQRYNSPAIIARERLVGIELKKNISVHYKNRLLLDKLVVAASKANIFDLIKVDYIVMDTAGAQARLMEEATKVIRRKAEA